MPRHTTRTASFAAAVALLALSPGAMAYSISIVNPSFELPNCMAGNCFMGLSFSVADIQGWSSSSTSGWGVFNPRMAGLTAYADAIPDGSDQVAYSTGAVISQTLSSVLTANTEYTLTFDSGRRPAPATFPGYEVRLMAGANLLASIGADPNSQTDPFVTRSLTYTATAGSPYLGSALRIELDSLGGNQSNFDNIRLTGNPLAAPSPGTLLLTLLGSGMLFAHRRRRKTG